jgi:hypothetical protein
VFFASNDGGSLGNSDINHNNKVGKISMKDVEASFQSLKPGDEGKAFQVPVTEVSISNSQRDVDTIIMEEHCSCLHRISHEQLPVLINH